MSKEIIIGTERQRKVFAGIGFSKRIIVYEVWNGKFWENIGTSDTGKKEIPNYYYQRQETSEDIKKEKTYLT